MRIIRGLVLYLSLYSVAAAKTKAKTKTKAKDGSKSSKVTASKPTSTKKKAAPAAAAKKKKETVKLDAAGDAIRLDMLRELANEPDEDRRKQMLVVAKEALEEHKAGMAETATEAAAAAEKIPKKETKEAPEGGAMAAEAPRLDPGLIQAIKGARRDFAEARRTFYGYGGEATWFGDERDDALRNDTSKRARIARIFGGLDNDDPDESFLLELADAAESSALPTPEERRWDVAVARAAKYGTYDFLQSEAEVSAWIDERCGGAGDVCALARADEASRYETSGGTVAEDAAAAMTTFEKVAMMRSLSFDARAVNPAGEVTGAFARSKRGAAFALLGPALRRAATLTRLAGGCAGAAALPYLGGRKYMDDDVEECSGSCCATMNARTRREASPEFPARKIERACASPLWAALSLIRWIDGPQGWASDPTHVARAQPVLRHVVNDLELWEVDAFVSTQMDVDGDYFEACAPYAKAVDLGGIDDSTWDMALEAVVRADAATAHGASMLNRHWPLLGLRDDKWGKRAFHKGVAAKLGKQAVALLGRGASPAANAFSAHFAPLAVLLAGGAGVRERCARPDTSLATPAGDVVCTAHAGTKADPRPSVLASLEKLPSKEEAPALDGFLDGCGFAAILDAIDDGYARRVAANASVAAFGGLALDGARFVNNVLASAGNAAAVADRDVKFGYRVGEGADTTTTMALLNARDGANAERHRGAAHEAYASQLSVLVFEALARLSAASPAYAKWLVAHPALDMPRGDAGTPAALRACPSAGTLTDPDWATADTPADVRRRGACMVRARYQEGEGHATYESDAAGANATLLNVLHWHASRLGDRGATRLLAEVCADASLALPCVYAGPLFAFYSGIISTDAPDVFYYHLRGLTHLLEGSDDAAHVLQELAGSSMAYEFFAQLAGLVGGARALPQPDHGGEPWGAGAYEGLWEPLAVRAQLATRHETHASFARDLKALAVRALARLARLPGHAQGLARALPPAIRDELCAALRASWAPDRHGTEKAAAAAAAALEGACAGSAEL